MRDNSGKNLLCIGEPLEVDEGAGAVIHQRGIARVLRGKRGEKGLGVGLILGVQVEIGKQSANIGVTRGYLVEVLDEGQGKVGFALGGVERG